jgi:hypothetical protein
MSKWEFVDKQRTAVWCNYIRSLPRKQRSHIFRGTTHLRELMFSDLSFLERDRTSILCMSRTEYLKSLWNLFFTWYEQRNYWNDVQFRFFITIINRSKPSSLKRKGLIKNDFLRSTRCSPPAINVHRTAGVLGSRTILKPVYNAGNRRNKIVMFGVESGAES